MTWIGLTEASKAVAAALGALAVLGYITGYLVLRARAHALGIDPPFDLVDEIYVFAGFRFLIWLLVLVTVAAPLVAAIVAAAAWLAKRVRASAQLSLAWAGLAVLAVGGVVLLSEVLAIRDLLFVEQDAPTASSLLALLDPRTAGYGPRVLGLEVFSVAMAVLTAIWLVRVAATQDRRAIVLALILALQLIQLPTLHGALRADRIVPVLTVIPTSAQGLEGTALIVDRNSSVATLFGRSETGQPALVTIPAKDLHGLPQGRPVPLFAPLAGPEPAVDGAVLKSAAPIVQSIPAEADVVADETSFLAAVSDRMGRMLDNLGALSNSEGLSGRIFEARLDVDGTVRESSPIGPEGIALSWPVVGEDGAIYALQDNLLVRVYADTAEVRDGRLHWRKLIGVLPSDAIVGLADVDGKPSGAVLHPGGEITTVPLSPTAFSTLLAETFKHMSGDILEVNRSARGGQGLDVYLIRGERRTDLSGCGNNRCVQPSMAPSRTRVLYVNVPPS
jgi:hypothetical protein